MFCWIQGKYSSTLSKRVFSMSWLNMFLSHLVYLCKICEAPCVNPGEVVASALDPKACHPNHCKSPAKVSGIHSDDFKAMNTGHLEKSPPPESPLQVSLVPSPAHSLVAPIVTRLT